MKRKRTLEWRAVAASYKAIVGIGMSNLYKRKGYRLGWLAGYRAALRDRRK